MKRAQLRILGIFLVLSLFVVSCQQDELTMGPAELNSYEAPVITYETDFIPGRYIVVLDKNQLDPALQEKNLAYVEKQNIMDREARNILARSEVSADKIYRVYGGSIAGMSVDLTEAELANLRTRPEVKYIEQDQLVTLAPPCGTPNGGPCPPDDGGGDGGDGGTSTQTIPCGITRVGGGISSSTNTAYVIDTGIDADHPDLNVAGGANFAKGGSWDDGNGHGTHVAGTIAAIDNNFGVIGVAPGAPVFAIRVLGNNGSGSFSDIIAGVDYVAANGSSGDVANMSLGGSSTSTALDDAVISAAQGGIKFAIAAGNSSADANNFTPARANHSNIYTVAAMTCNDSWASFSNYGRPPIDYIAPGVSVESTYKGGGYASLSGTSMAAPHVAGLLLLGNVQQDGSVTGPDGASYPIAH